MAAIFKMYSVHAQLLFHVISSSYS